MNRFLIITILLVAVAIILLLPASLAACGVNGLHLSHLLGGGACGSLFMEFMSWDEFNNFYQAIVLTLLAALCLFIYCFFKKIWPSILPQASAAKRRFTFHPKFFEKLFIALARGLLHPKFFS